MARVQAEFRLSPVWLLWLLIALAALVALAIFAGARAHHLAPPVASPASAAGPVTNLLTIVDAPDKLALVGRRVVVKDVPVASVAGEGVFWAGKPGRQAPVVIDSAGRGQMRAGQTVNITGRVARAQREQLEKLAGQPVYIAAESVTVAGR